ncbi:MAG TPA: hypothetical protein VFC78_07245 [Tepidisphaeraceae bacterium]|nr:hypothetical protein [Tepidisphaeraceae bacterium]
MIPQLPRHRHGQDARDTATLLLREYYAFAGYQQAYGIGSH